MIKSGYIWKTKNCTKNHLCKIWASGQFKYTIEIWQLLKKVEFLSAQNAPFGRPWCPNAIRNSTPIIFFSSLRIFYVKMTTSERGERVHISIVGTGPININKVICKATANDLMYGRSQKLFILLMYKHITAKLFILLMSEYWWESRADWK